MAAMSYLLPGLSVQLYSMDVPVEDIEKALTPMEDEENTIALLYILYNNHCEYA